MREDPYLDPDFTACALITIDAQRDVLDRRPLEIPGTSAMLPAISRLLEAFRRARAPIVHIVRLYSPDGSNVDLCRRALVKAGAEILAPGSEGSELAEALLWGAFFRTPLEAHLRGLGVSTVVVCGCNFPNCPRTSIYEASERDLRVVLATDAVSGLYERGEQELAAIGVRLMTTDAIDAAVAGQLAARS